ncbi:MAG TPA: heavy metal translocating P-type ATPase [Bacilli bacterium]|nr:heavy metal translocating P-type ATPase [Bacilli bacterium]
MEIIKKQFFLDNLENSNYIRKIEFDLNKEFPGSFKLNKETKLLTVDFNENDDIEAKTLQITKIIKAVDAGIDIKPRAIKQTYRRVLILENLDCAICASKVERIAKRTFNYEFIVVDFASTRFIIETTDVDLIAHLEERVQNITQMVDPAIKVVQKTKKKHQFETDFKQDKAGRNFFIIGVSIFVFGFLLKTILKEMTNVKPIIVTFIIYVTYTVGYIMLAWDVLYGAYKNIRSGRIFDEKFLMSLATITALIVGYYDEAVFVMIFYKIGEIFQHHAINYSRKSIAALMDIQPDVAHIIVNGEVVEVDPMEVVVGDMIYVRPGERLPLDGIVYEGESSLDVSALTGESIHKDVRPGHPVLAGSINTNGTLKVKVTSIYEDSMVAKILNLVENASSHKTKSETFISKFARYYTPTVVILAVVLAIVLPFILPTYDLSWTNGFKRSILLALIFLVISCPCALVLSVPLGFFGGIGGASRQGILIKGSNYLEALNTVDTIVFDKTGTLTTGKFVVSDVLSFGKLSPEQILEYAAHCELNSNHLIAKSIVEAYGKERLTLSRIASPKQMPGLGVSNFVDGLKIVVGKKSFLEQEGLSVPAIDNAATKVYVAVGDKTEGCIIVKDQIKQNTHRAIADLKAMGIKRTVMLTGDTEEIAQEVATEVGIDEMFAELTPLQKVEKLNDIKAQSDPHKKVAFVGDGINDAPVISSADIGIAMGGLGSDAAIQVADIVLMTDDLSKLPIAKKIAKKTHNIVVQNITLALGVKFIVLILALIEPFIVNSVFSFLLDFLIYEALFADVGVSLIAILNSWRATKVPK